MDMRGMLLATISILILSACRSEDVSNTKQMDVDPLLIYVGAASKPPTEEIVAAFTAETGIQVEAIYGGSGYVLSQLKLSGKGDIYFPGSSDYMEIAKREGLVDPLTELQVVYLVNAINVQRGNPKKITSLQDLCRPGLKIAIANPEGVCVGAYAIEIIENHLSASEQKAFRKNLVNYTESCDKTAAVVALGSVDAVIGWSVFEHWNPKRIESIAIPADQLIRIGYIPIAVTSMSKQPDKAKQFLQYINGPKGKSIFQKYQYFITSEEAKLAIGKELPVGGEYEVPQDWMNQ
jgi:molybdate transport system substrate-binding protein